METKADPLLGVPYRQMPRVQSAIAEAHATLASARSSCQHVVAQTKTWEGVGSLLVGNPGGHPMI